MLDHGKKLAPIPSPIEEDICPTQGGGSPARPTRGRGLPPIGRQVPPLTMSGQEEETVVVVVYIVDCFVQGDSSEAPRYS